MGESRSDSLASLLVRADDRVRGVLGDDPARERHSSVMSE